MLILLCIILFLSFLYNVILALRIFKLEEYAVKSSKLLQEMVKFINTTEEATTTMRQFIEKFYTEYKFFVSKFLDHTEDDVSKLN